MGILPYGRDDMRLTLVVKGTGESVDRALIRHGLDAWIKARYGEKFAFVALDVRSQLPRGTFDLEKPNLIGLMLLQARGYQGCETE